MRMNGSGSRRSRRVCNSDGYPALHTKRFVGAALCMTCVLVVFGMGCGDMRWTRFEFINQGKEKLWVDVRGITPNPSPGVLGYWPDREKRSVAAANFHTPVQVDETVRVEWARKDVDEKHVVEFTRAELGVGERVRGGTFRFAYHGGEKWTVDYDPRRVE
jgi:hypothetical protein